MSNIEGELSRLTTLLETSSSQTEEESPITFPADDQFTKDTPSLLSKDHHIVRSQRDLLDRYHGPCTLFALCKEFYDATLSEQGTQTPFLAEDETQNSPKQDRQARNEAVKDLLARMCLEAGIEESLDLQLDPTPVRLPPKQFLLMAQTQFFQQADYATDIFVETCFRSNVERIYSRPFSAADEAWAICFNVIMLLVLGLELSSQGNDPLVGSQFALPFLLTVRTALNNPRILMTPKLINVQALALLVSTPNYHLSMCFATMMTNSFGKSIAAQQYFPLGLTESIFAQACVLARTMGLHQTHAASDGVSPEEAQGRFKVFRSLYLRDKNLSISRGSLSWLPSFDCSLSSELGQIASTDSNGDARIQLAGLKEDIYRLFHSAESQRQSSAKHKSAFSRMEQSLERWANTHVIFGSSCTGARDIELQLEFLAARISAFRGRSQPSYIRQALNDARASCLLLLISYGKHDQSMIHRLETLLLLGSPSKYPAETASPRPSKGKTSNKDSSTDTARENTSEFVLLQFQILDTFSVPGFFLLAKNLIWPVSANDESQADEDMNLLQKVCTCYKELDARIQANNHIRKVGRVFERLLEVVNLTKDSQQLPMPPPVTHQGSDARTSPSTQDFFGGSQGLSDFADLPVPSAHSMPAISWDAFSAMNTSTRITGTATRGTSPGLPTRMESEYIDQRYDQLSQPSVPSPSSRKRPRLYELDMSMDDPESSLLSEFLATSPMMSF